MYSWTRFTQALLSFSDLNMNQHGTSATIEVLRFLALLAFDRREKHLECHLPWGIAHLNSYCVHHSKRTTKCNKQTRSFEVFLTLTSCNYPQVPRYIRHYECRVCSFECSHVNGNTLLFHAFNISSFLCPRLKIDEHSMECTKTMIIWQILLLQQAKHWCRVLIRNACFCKIPASDECQRTILVHCIDHYKVNL